MLLTAMSKSFSVSGVAPNSGVAPPPITNDLCDSSSHDSEFCGAVGNLCWE